METTAKLSSTIFYTQARSQSETGGLVVKTRIKKLNGKNGGPKIEWQESAAKKLRWLGWVGSTDII